MLTLTTTALCWPWVVDLYHMQAGARALHSALGKEDQLIWWYIGPREVYDAQALQRSIVHLTRVRFQPYAWRLLGQAYVAQGDILHSIEALERFTAARPQHPLGQLELAAAYMLAQEQWQTMYRIDLLAHLTEAVLSAPDLTGSVRYVTDGWTSQYVYPTRFVLPPDEQERPTLFLHSGSQVTFTLSLTQPAVLHFDMALDPHSLDWGGDGATFEVFVNGQRIFLEHLTIEMARAGWQERRIDLSAWTGQTISLTLATAPGPRADNTADWAGWGELQLVEAKSARCLLASCQDRAAAAWKEGGFTAQDLIQAGAKAQIAGRYDKALWLYRAGGISSDIDIFAEIDVQPVVIESFVTSVSWNPCPWCENTDGFFETRNGILEIFLHNMSERRDGFGILCTPMIFVSGFRELLMRVKGEPGTHLTLEIVVDGIRVRPLDYQPVPEDWDVWAIPIDGEILNEILIGIEERDSLPTPGVYRLLIDWIALQ